jgi:hypothetical protein
MSSNESDTFAAMRTEFVLLCREAGVYDEETKYVALDKLWRKPELFVRYVRSIVGFVRYATTDKLSKPLLLIIPENITASYGILPAGSVAAYELKCALGIWREFGDVTWGRSKYFGPPVGQYDCVVLQDVVRYGSTILNIANTLGAQDLRILAYLAMVLNSVSNAFHEPTRKEYVEEAKEPLTFLYMASVRDLRLSES